MKKIKLVGLTSTVLILALQNTPLQAYDIYYTSPPSVEELETFFDQQETKSGRHKRGMELHTEPPVVPSGAIVFKTNRKGPPQNNMPIEFAFNSDTMLPSSIRYVEKIGNYLTKRQSESMVIEGHTDSIGSSKSNLVLSKQRANAVRSYLVDNFNIDPSRLKPRGLGEKRPLPNFSPEAKQNRRVQFYRAG